MISCTMCPHLYVTISMVNTIHGMLLHEHARITLSLYSLQSQWLSGYSINTLQNVGVHLNEIGNRVDRRINLLFKCDIW